MILSSLANIFCSDLRICRQGWNKRLKRARLLSFLSWMAFSYEARHIPPHSWNEFRLQWNDVNLIIKKFPWAFKLDVLFGATRYKSLRQKSLSSRVYSRGSLRTFSFQRERQRSHSTNPLKTPFRLLCRRLWSKRCRLNGCFHFIIHGVNNWESCEEIRLEAACSFSRTFFAFSDFSFHSVIPLIEITIF